MALFQSIDVMGPAHRGAQIQQLAQSAAQNVMRRQRMRALLKTGAAAASSAASHATGGGMNSIRSSMMRHPVGVRGNIMRPAITAQQLAAMAASAGVGATLPGGGNSASLGGLFSAGGGGYDFGSLPDANDMSQSPASTLPVQQNDVLGPPAPAAAPAVAAATSGLGLPTNPDGTQNVSSLFGAPAPSASQAGAVMPDGSISLMGDYNPGQPQGLVNLGNGLYYDPVTDAVRGMPSPRR